MITLPNTIIIPTSWDYEDQIRQQTHDAEIANTAKENITANDLRASTKYAINSLLSSSIVEEKSYPCQQKKEQGLKC